MLDYAFKNTPAYPAFSLDTLGCFLPFETSDLKQTVFLDSAAYKVFGLSFPSMKVITFSSVVWLIASSASFVKKP